MNISGPIIIVDDDEDDHDIIKAICKKLGICDFLMFFNSGIDLLKFLRTSNQRPFVILCDINMPAMDGLAVRKLIESDPYLKSKSVPFIFFSTSSTKEQIRTAYDMTVQGYFVKGITLEETERKLRRILEYWSDCKHPNSIYLPVSS
jgi:CheY-like chemotaxis protein